MIVSGPGLDRPGGEDSVRKESLVSLTGKRILWPLLPLLLIGAACSDQRPPQAAAGSTGLLGVYQMRIDGVAYAVNRKPGTREIYEVRTQGGAPSGWENVSRAIRWAYGCERVELLTLDKINRYAEAKGVFCRRGQQRFR